MYKRKRDRINNLIHMCGEVNRSQSKREGQTVGDLKKAKRIIKEMKETLGIVERPNDPVKVADKSLMMATSHLAISVKAIDEDLLARV